MPNPSTLRNEIEQILADLNVSITLDEDTHDKKPNTKGATWLGEQFDYHVDTATRAILSAFLARLPKDTFDVTSSQPAYDKGYADGCSDCLNEVKKLLEIE